MNTTEEIDGDVEMGASRAQVPRGADENPHLVNQRCREMITTTRELKAQGREGGELVYTLPEYPQLPNKDTGDWQYVMRRTMQEIIPGLFLGPYAAATRAKLSEMQAAGITHVVCVREFLERNLVRPNHPEHFKYLVVEVKDVVMANIIPHFRSVSAFVTEALEGGGKVLVHGNAGISRSAALVIAFIMEKYGVTTKEAFSFVQSKRFCCNPNEGFMAQLREYEPIYRAMHVVPVPLPGNRSTLKRSREAETEIGVDEDQA